MLRDGDFTGFDLIVNGKFHFFLFPEDFLESFLLNFFVPTTWRAVTLAMALEAARDF